MLVGILVYKIPSAILTHSTEDSSTELAGMAADIVVLHVFAHQAAL